MKFIVENVCSFSTLPRTIPIAISTSFTYLNNLKETMASKITCPHILYITFIDYSGCNAPCMFIFIIKKFVHHAMMDPTKVQP
jgi:hypothetical protein